MKSVLALALLVGAVLSNSTSYYGWKPQQELVYRFESQLLTGIPQIRYQWAGLKLASEVRIQTYNDYSLRIKFENPKFIVVNQKLEQREGLPVVPQPNQEIPEELKKHLIQPFHVTLKKGVIEELSVESSEPVVITNIKKALLSQLQMDLSGARRGEIDFNRIPTGEAHSKPLGEEQTSYFTTEEKSVVGDCETSYTVQPLPKYQSNGIESAIKDEGKEYRNEGEFSGPGQKGDEICEGKQYYEIIKTKNFDNCKQRPVFQTAIGMKTKCDISRSSCKDLINHLSSTRYVICGSREEFYIREATTENTILTNPMGWNTTPEKQISAARVTLFLVKVNHSGSYTPFPQPQEPKRQQSLIFEFPLNKENSSRGKQYTQQGYLNKPSLHNSSSVTPSFIDFEPLSQQLVADLKKVAEQVFNSPESCSSKTDVAGSVSVIAQALRPLSYEQIKEIDQKLASNLQGEHSQVSYNIWYDILAMTGSNPSVMLIKEKLMNGQLQKYNALPLVESVIRNVRTPTEELFKELFEMVKSLKSSHRQQYQTGLIQLSNLVNSACINPDTMDTQFPSRIYGRFCSEESSFLKQEYLPYLAREMENAQGSDRLILISALGKIGHRNILEPLSKQIQKEQKPVTRSLAVYSLKRLAKRNPAIVRPILLALIDNPAENPQVRIAAIATLPWAQPSTAELQKMAVRSWFEPSKQVSSFVYSTLQSLTKTEVPELKPVGIKAQNILSLVKPSQYGIEYSKNYHNNKFVRYLLTAASGQVSYVNTEESLVPARVSLSSYLYGAAWEMNGVTFTAYSEGMDSLVEKLMDHIGYKTEVSREVQEQLQEINEKLQITKREPQQSESLFQWKMAGFERMYTLNKEIYSEILSKASEELRRNPELFTEGTHFNNAQATNLINIEGFGPTDAGFPIYVQRNVPVVYGIKGSFQAEGEVSSKSTIRSKVIPVVNAKIQANMGTISPFTMEFIGSGVEMSIHFCLPFELEMNYNNRRQLTIKLRNTEEMKNEIEVVHGFIQPYTVVNSLKTIKPISKSANIKWILSGVHMNKYESAIGRNFGIDAKVQLQSDFQSKDFAGFYNLAKEHNLYSILTLGSMTPSIRSGFFKILYNPGQSSAREIESTISWVEGRKVSETDETEVTYPSEEEFGSQREAEIQRECREQHSSSEAVDRCVEKKTKASESHCESHNKAREMLREMRSGKVHGVSMHSSVNYEGESKSYHTVVVAGKNQEGNQFKTALKVQVKTANSEIYEINAGSVAELPEMPYRWNIQNIVGQNVEMKLNAWAQYGRAQGEKQEIRFDSRLHKNEEQKSSVQQSQEYKRCQEQISQHQQPLSSVCEEMRHQALSVNEIDSSLSIPRQLQQNSLWQRFETAIKGYYLSNLYNQESHGSSSSHGDNAQYKIRAGINRRSDEAWAKVQTPNSRFELKQIRVPITIRGYAPLSLRNGASLRIIQDVSRDQMPASCRLDRNFISTFDNKTYTYQMNECYHLLFKDCRNREPMAVLARKNGQSNTDVKIQTGLYNVELLSQGSNIEVRINGQQEHFSEMSKMIKRSKSTGEIVLVVYRTRDNVFQVWNPVQGLEVFTDGQRIEVVGPQYLKNRACGLCGDMNGENTADLKTPKKCLMKEPRFAAYSYMLSQGPNGGRSEGQCPRIPSQDREQYEKEMSQCVQKRDINTRIVHLAESFTRAQPYPISKVHIVDWQRNQICLSKSLVKVCPKGSKPTKGKQVTLRFTCLTKPSNKAEQLAKRAESGEVLSEVMTGPTNFSKKMYEPVQCEKSAGQFSGNYRGQSNGNYRGESSESSGNYRGESSESSGNYRTQQRGSSGQQFD